MGRVKKLSQKQMILAHLLQHGSITPDVSWTEYGCYRLSDVIYRLRADGYNITTKTKEGVSKITGLPTECAEYTLVNDAA